MAGLVDVQRQIVSIHTPTKGVTEYKTSFDRFNGVSIHTPTKGVTNDCIAYVSPIGVSIHTPTKGVTHISITNMKAMPSFNPHTHEGCDLITTLTITGRDKFQSTHPRRV